MKWLILAGIALFYILWLVPGIFTYGGDRKSKIESSIGLSIMIIVIMIMIGL